MHKLLLSLVLSSAAFTAAAHADTFNFYGKTESGLVATGTINTGSTGVVNGGLIHLPSQYGGFDLSFVMAQTYADLSKVLVDTEGTKIYLYLPNTLAAGSTVSVCSTTTDCPAYDGSVASYVVTYGDTNIDRFVSATLTSQNPSAVTTAATPEPSSLILLGTGALGMAGAVRRRFLARA